MLCNKCNVDQPEENYEQYWHSTQQKFRTRRICRTCISQQKREYKLKIKQKKLEVVKEPTQACSKCGIEYPVSHYYTTTRTKKPIRKCKTCYNRRPPKSAWQNLDYRTQPNEYISEEQKDIVHMIMRNIGWSFNPDKGIWYKLPLKDENGNWNIVIKPKEPVKKFVPKRETIQLNVNEILQHRANGLTYNQIASIYSVSHTTIKVRVKQYLRGVNR